MRFTPIGRIVTTDFFACCAPIIYLDEREPFLPARVGISLMTRTQASPSFQRVLELAPPVTRVIEYAVWFEWDIAHLNELEHLWVYLDSGGQIVDCEGSWHGYYQTLKTDGRLLLEDGHPVAYAKPGKHAFASRPEVFAATREECERECGPLAGRGGLQFTHLLLGKLEKRAQDDALIRAYLQRRAFTPAWRFNRRFALTPELLAPWEDLESDIPRRIVWWLEQLRAGMR